MHGRTALWCWAFIGLLSRVLPAFGGIPAGGLDLISDYWIRQQAKEETPQPLDGPTRLALTALSISGIKNNVENAHAAGGVFSSESTFMGPVFVGGSFGRASGSTLDWSHTEVHVGYLVSERFAARIGFNDDTYEYPTNQRGSVNNVFRDQARGLEVGLDLFGSPRPGAFLQLSGDVVPMSTTLVSGGSGESTAFFRGCGLLGFTLLENLDLSFLAMAASRLGDDRSVAAQLGAMISCTF